MWPDVYHFSQYRSKLQKHFNYEPISEHMQNKCLCCNSTEFHSKVRLVAKLNIQAWSLAYFMSYSALIYPGLLQSCCQDSKFPSLSYMCRIQRGHAAVCGKTLRFPVYFTQRCCSAFKYSLVRTVFFLVASGTSAQT